MKSNIIKLTSNGSQSEEVFDEVQKCAEYADLTKKDELHLRLLAEELVGMIREVLEEYEADLWVENEKKVFKIHLLAKARLGSQRKEQLLSLAKDGKNMAAKGIMGKIRRVMEICVLADGDDYSMYMDSYTPFAAGIESTGLNYVNLWSLNQYRNTAAQQTEEWDELEKSIVAKLADDVSVGVQNGKAEIIITKDFRKRI